MHLVDSVYSTFTNPELARLTAYRAAVAAGFYTDWDGSAESTDTEALAWLRVGGGAAEPATYPFTAEERQRLERCKAAVARGTYSDQLAAVDAGATPEA